MGDAVRYWGQLIAGYLSVMGLGFMFACLILGATQFLLPLAVFMFVCAAVSVALDTNKMKGL